MDIGRITQLTTGPVAEITRDMEIKTTWGVLDDYRRQLAEAQTEIEHLRAAVLWALGEAPDANGKWFGDSKPETENGTPPRPYWWRTHLRALSGHQQSGDTK